MCQYSQLPTGSAGANEWPTTSAAAAAGEFIDQEAFITDKSTSGAPAAAEAGASAAAANGTLTDVQMGVGWDEPGCSGAYMAGL